MRVPKIHIVSSNMHSLLTKCIAVSLFISFIDETTLLNLPKSPSNMHRNSEWYRTATALLSNGNITCDPCEDFYEFTCGQWTTKHQPPPHAVRWNNFRLAKEKTQAQLKNILTAQSKHSEHHLKKQTRQLYKTCMDDDILQKKGLLPLMQAMQRVGHWPMRENLSDTVGQISWLKAHYSYARMTGEGALFNINVLPDARDPTVHRIHIRQPTSLFGQYRYVPKKKIATYKNSLKAIVRMRLLNEWINISGSTIQRLIDDVVQFRQELLKLMVVGQQSRLEAQLHNLMSIAALQRWNAGLARDNHVIEIDWLNVLTETFRHAKKIHFDQSEMIIVREFSYLRRLLFLLTKTPAWIIANHIHLHFAEMHLRYTTPEMRKLVADLYTSVSGRKTEDRRWYNCVQENEMKHVLASMYVEKHFPDSNAKEVTDIFNNVRNTVEEMLKHSFLRAPTKESFIKKLRNMKAIIGYRDWHKNYTLLAAYYTDQKVGDVYLENQLSSKTIHYRVELELLHNNVPKQIDDVYAFIPNAEYDPAFNSIEITASFLQWPAYSPSSHTSVAYGTTGQIFAHEIFHGFDIDGIWYDENGVTCIPWSTSNLDKYHERVGGIMNKYAESIARAEPSGNAELTANRTIGEDFSDVVGLEASFRTYRKQLRHQRRRSSTGTMTSLHEDQIFFRAYGNMFCEFVAPGYVDDSHSNCRLRVNGPLSNLQEFSDAFDCHQGQPMSSKKKCAFWKS